jgi:hypothetical protein
MGCRDVAQHAKRAVKAEVRFSATDPYRTLAAPFAVNRMPRSAVEEHRLRTLAGSESPWVSKYVNARTRIEEKLYRHPGRQHRTTTRRWIAREIQLPCLPRLAPFVGGCAEPQCERQIARTIVCRAAFRTAVLVQNHGPLPGMIATTGRDAKQYTRASPGRSRACFTDRRIPVPTNRSGRAQHRPIQGEDQA